MGFGNWPQLYGREPGRCRATWPRSSARPSGGYYDVSKQVATVGNKWIGVPWTVGGGLIAYRKSWLEEAGYTTFPETWDDLPRGRQEAEGQGTADRPDRRPHVRRRAGLVVSLPVVVRRQGGRGRRQDRRAEQQGNGRVDQVRRRPVEGDHGRRRARLGRHQQQPRLPVADHQRHQQRRLDLHRSQEEARHLQDREGHADVAGHPARPHPQGTRRPVQPARPVHRHGDGLLQEPEGGQGLPALDPHASRSTTSGSPRSRATPAAPPRCGRSTRCGTSIRC